MFDLGLGLDFISGITSEHRFPTRKSHIPAIKLALCITHLNHLVKSLSSIQSSSSSPDHKTHSVSGWKASQSRSVGQRSCCSQSRCNFTPSL